MIQQKVRKKKRSISCSCKKKVKLDCTMYSEQTNKTWSLKRLVTLKCENRTSLHAVQYKCDSQVLF